MSKTSIEWSEVTWNPVTGCSRTSPGCDICYAMTMAARLKAMGSAKYQNDGEPPLSGPGFGVTLHPDVVEEPLRWRKPRTVFVNSMSDLFHPEIPDEFICRVFDVMAQAERHTFQVLTKRSQRMASLTNDRLATPEEVDDGYELGIYPSVWDIASSGIPTRNVWLGVSIENDRYTFRANHLRGTSAAVRFLSLEPLLGPLPSLDLNDIDWVIVGAESGRGARPMDEGWVRDIRDHCVERDIPFFYKQRATPSGHKVPLPDLDGRVWNQMPERMP